MKYVISSWIFILVYFSVLFIIGMLQKDNSIVDMGWGFGFVLVALFTFFRTWPADGIDFLLLALVVIWGGRLASHIFTRNQKRGEDFRYASFRKSWGKWLVPRAFFQIYMLQAFMMGSISIGYIWALTVADKHFSIFVFLGILVWLFGFYFESTADRQLKMFLSNQNNRGKVLSTGLWKYSRHPNYFGEATMWWGIFIISFAVSGNIFLIISPITITILVRFISGVPLLEKTMLKNPEYRNYARKTNTFLPFSPKKGGKI